MSTLEDLEKKLAGINEIRDSGKLELAANGLEMAHKLIFAQLQIEEEIAEIKRLERERIEAERLAVEAKNNAVEEKLQLEAQAEISNMIDELDLTKYID